MDVLSKKLLKPTFVNGAWRKPLSVRKQKILGLAEAKPIDPTPKRWELKENKGHRYIKKQNDRYVDWNVCWKRFGSLHFFVVSKRF